MCIFDLIKDAVDVVLFEHGGALRSALLCLPGPAEAPGVGAGPRHQEHLNHPQNDLMCW